jgi:hypothetical protein
MLWRCLEVSASLVFLVKKLPNSIKDLKTVKSIDPKPKKQTVATKKRIAAAIERIPLKAMAQCWCLPGAAPPGNVSLDLCCLSWLKTGSPAGRRAHARRQIPSGNIAARWQIAVLPLYSPPLNLLDYGNRSIVQSKGKATTHPKIGALKQTVWQWSRISLKFCMSIESVFICCQFCYCSSVFWLLFVSAFLLFDSFFCSIIQYSIIWLFSVFSVLILELYSRFFDPHINNRPTNQ